MSKIRDQFSNAMFSGGKGAGFGASYGPEEQQTIGRKVLDGTASTVDAAFGAKTETPLSKLTGNNHIANNAGLKTNANALASGAKSGENVQSNVTAQSVHDDVQTAKANFVQDLQQTQAQLSSIMNEVGAEMGLSKGAIAGSFQPAPQRSEAGAVAMVAGGLVGSATIGAVSAVYDAKRAMGDNLSPDQEAELAQRIQEMLTPGQDGVVEIPNNFDQNFLEQQTPQQLVQLFKDVMRPAHEQPEMQFFNDIEAQLEPIMAVHNQNHDRDETTVAFEEYTGIEVSAVDVAVDGPEIDSYSDFEDYGISPVMVEYAELPPTQLVDQPIAEEAMSMREIAAFMNDAKPLIAPQPAYNPDEEFKRAGAANDGIYSMSA